MLVEYLLWTGVLRARIVQNHAKMFYSAAAARSYRHAGSDVEATRTSGPEMSRSLAADPSRAGRRFLGGTVGHVFGSEDSGAHWTLLGRVNSRLDAVVTAIVVEPSGNVLFASAWTQDPSAGGGVFRSEDGGRTWRNAGLQGQAVRALAVAPSIPINSWLEPSMAYIARAMLPNLGNEFLQNITRNCGTLIRSPSIRAIRRPFMQEPFIFPGRRRTAGATGDPSMMA